MQHSNNTSPATFTPVKRDKPLLLVAAPDLVIRRMLQGVLEDYGYQVCTAGNCDEMTRLFTQHQPDLVLVDIGTPDTQAFDACGLLHELAGATPLPMLVMADQGGAETVTRIFQAGATDFYVKPMDPQLLKEKIRQSLHYRDIELALQQTQCSNSGITSRRCRPTPHQPIAADPVRQQTVQ